MKTDKEVGIKLGIEALKTMRSGMTLKEAIEIKQLALDTGVVEDPDDFKAADKLSIEALKALPEYRKKLKHPELWLLPGETA